MKVLYADSDIEVRDYVSMILEAGLDCEILEASSGNEALSILEFDSDIDFVISEVQMKGGGGHLIVEYLDAHKIEVPFVWLSKKENQDTMIVQEVVHRSALNAFVPKPFKDDQFFPVINRILEIQEIKRQNQSQESFASWDSLKNNGIETKENTDFYGGAREWSQDNPEEASQEGWDDLKGQTSDQEADWSLRKDHNKNELAGDWRKSHSISENELNYGLDRNQAGWDMIRDNVQKKVQERAEKEGLESIKPAELLYDHEKYHKIKIKRFYNFTSICCDVFIQLSPVKYIKLIKAQDSYDDSFIEKYEERGKKFLFIEKENFQRFQEQFGHLVMDKLEKAAKMPADIRAVAELAAFEHTLDFVKQFGITPNTANKVKKSVESNLKTLKELPTLEKLLKRIMRGGDYISEHSLMLSYFAGQIAINTSWGNHSTLEKLSMAALLHDVTLPQNHLARIHQLKEAKEKDLSDREIDIIKNHPGEAARLINQGESIFPDVDTIVMQHHELPDQSGFPRGLGALSISPLSCIFILASEFTERVYGQVPSQIDIEAIKKEFQNIFNRGNFKKPLDAFLKSF